MPYKRRKQPRGLLMLFKKWPSRWTVLWAIWPFVRYMIQEQKSHGIIFAVQLRWHGLYKKAFHDNIFP